MTDDFSAPRLRYERLDPYVTHPTRAYENSAGYDLHAFLLTENRRPSIAHIPPHTTRAIRTGLIVAPPEGYFVSICSRSGLALHATPICVYNAPGIVDPDYRGEIKVILYNGGTDVYSVRHGERIAQMVICSLFIMPLDEQSLAEDKTLRGDKGFGSTGL